MAYSLGSLNPLVIEFKGHKRFWQLSEVRFQSSWTQRQHRLGATCHWHRQVLPAGITHVGMGSLTLMWFPTRTDRRLRHGGGTWASNHARFPLLFPTNTLSSLGTLGRTFFKGPEQPGLKPSPERTHWKHVGSHWFKCHVTTCPPC